ncbi:MAG: IS21 family transposase [Deltaproteobacteria bacterium]|nr:IS21 family transposase [Deltaproteobacteria bacterium]
MLIVETIRKIRCAYERDKKSIRQIARDFNLARNTVKKMLKQGIIDQQYIRKEQPLPRLGPYQKFLSERLSSDSTKPKREQRTAQVLFEELQRQGYAGGYDSVKRFVRKWRDRQEGKQVAAYIPQAFDPGESFQFDWSHELVELGGELVRVRVAHFRLSWSRMPFCVAYTREGLEMVLDAHVRAFEFFGGSCRKGIYDNLKTVVTKVLLGKERTFNRRFLNLASHYLFEPVACTPAAGWEKGQVENQVRFIRNRLFVPRLKFADIEELNRWLSDRCRTLAAGHKHPEYKERTVAECFAEEQKQLLVTVSPFDGYKEVPARVTTTALVAYDNNRYSVNAKAVGRTAMVRAYATRIIIVHDGNVIGVHKREFKRDQVIYDPWHYLEILKRKPGALRNGAPFKEWNLPQPLTEMRYLLSRKSDGDRQFVGILSVIAIYGLEEVAAACSEAIAGGAASRDVVFNILTRNLDEPAVAACEIPPHLPEIKALPHADCNRYDELLSGGAYVAG